MASEKNILALAVLAKTESVYGAGASITGSTDYIHTAELPEFSIEYAYDGARPVAPGSAGNQRRNTPSGRTTAGTIRIEGKGSGTGYSGTYPDIPVSLHPFLLASGMSGSQEGGTMVYRVAPLSVTPTSLAMQVYTRGEIRSVSGAYCDMAFGSETAAAPVFEFTVQGIMALPATSTVPGVRVPASSSLPPKAESINLLLNGTIAPKVRTFRFEMGREIGPRFDVSTTGTSIGFAPARRNPRLTLSVEASSLATFDPYTARASGTQYSVSFTVGSSATNRYVFTAPQAQLVDVQDAADGPVAMWNLVFDCVPSLPYESDDFRLQFN